MTQITMAHKVSKLELLNMIMKILHIFNNIFRTITSQPGKFWNTLWMPSKIVFFTFLPSVTLHTLTGTIRARARVPRCGTVLWTGRGGTGNCFTYLTRKTSRGTGGLETRGIEWVAGTAYFRARKYRDINNTSSCGLQDREGEQDQQNAGDR